MLLLSVPSFSIDMEEFSSRLHCKVSIIVPVYQGGHPFTQCLESIRAFAGSAWEVIVVIDGEDESAAIVAKQFGHRVLQLPKNGGPAKARNVGAQVASGDILFFVDADVALAPETLPQIQTLFQQDHTCDAMIGSYDDHPGAANFLSQYKNLLHHYTHQHGRSEASTFWGACGAIRRSVFWEVGGFDERYQQPSIEDIELGYRLRRCGYRILLDKQIQVKHLKRWSAHSLLRADFFYRALPWTHLIWRDRQLVNDLNLDTHSRLSIVSVYAMVACLTLSIGWQWLLPIAIGFAVMLLSLNASIYQFFWEKRSLLFTLKVIPWHWFYYAYSGIAFLVGTLQYWTKKRSKLDYQPPMPIRTPVSHSVMQPALKNAASVEFAKIEFATANSRER